MSNQPMNITSENTQRTIGRDAQRINILAGKLVAETVRTTLGPKGMDKMIVDTLGDVIITNDGVTILNEMQIDHPTAKMIVEVAKTQENEVGDGTTTAVILAGELLKNAEALLDKNIHPTVIAKGYRLAAEKSHELLNALAEHITKNDDVILKKIAITAMTGKGAESAKDSLGDIAVKAVKGVMVEDGDKCIIDLENIKIEKKVGGSVDDTELVRGIILDKEKVHSSMPSKVTNAAIALIDSALEIKDTETDAKIQITSPDQMQAFLDQEEKMLKDMVDKVVNSNATVVFCQKGIDDLAQHFLAKQGIYAVRRVKKSDMEKLAKATGAKIINRLGDLTRLDLGFAALVSEKKIGDESMTYVEGCKNPKAVTILIRGSTEHVVAEVKRAMDDAIGDVGATLKDGKVVGGAGSIEMELAAGLRKFANSLKGREQLAVNAFAEAVEIVPRTLAENAGIDPIDVLTDLKAHHDKKIKWAGINVFTGKCMDAWKAGVIEPLKIKTQAISSASEVAIMILRIDDVIAGNGNGNADMPPHDMGGMPGGMM